MTLLVMTAVIWCCVLIQSFLSFVTCIIDNDFYSPFRNVFLFSSRF